MTSLNSTHPRRRAYGEDLRRLAVMAVLEDGMSLAAAGRRFGVSETGVASWVMRWRERGHLRADARGGDRKSWRIEAERERIFRILERQPAHRSGPEQPSAVVRPMMLLKPINPGGGARDAAENGPPPTVRSGRTALAALRGRVCGRGRA